MSDFEFSVEQGVDRADPEFIKAQNERRALGYHTATPWPKPPKVDNWTAPSVVERIDAIRATRTRDTDPDVIDLCDDVARVLGVVAGDGYDGAPHAEAVAELEDFIAQAQAALEALKARREVKP